MRWGINLREMVDILASFQAFGQVCEESAKFQMVVMIGARIVALSFHTQYGMQSGPEAVFFILDKAIITSCSHNLGAECVLGSIWIGTGS